MTVDVVFEDKNFLVVNKPPGLVANQTEAWVGKNFLVHRLDRETSGLLLVAKTAQALEELQRQFKNREVVKKYLALVHGKVEPAEGVINIPIGRNPFNREHFGIFPGGRPSQTSYKTYNTYKAYTLLELTPKTGRTHQIRVHLKYLGHPVVSDALYGGRKNYRADLKFCPRLFLHATYLRIKHPVTGKALEFNSSLPSDLAGVLELLK